MAAHIEADEPFERSEIGADEAIERFRAEDQPYKVELIEDLARDEGVETVSLYRNGPFVDLCRGPHGPSTGRIKAFKLSSVAGAYWRGDEARQMLTRIYGTAFFAKRDLEEHLERLEQARARDHRRLGPELGLFTLRPESPGMPFWLPQGTVLLRLVEREVREQLARRGYVEIKTPQILDEELWRRSGHWDNYREEMFFTDAARARARRGAPLRAEADELPRGVPRLRIGAPFLPRPAAAPRRVRPRVAQRARGRPARPAAGSRLHPGRRPRLLHARPDHRRGGLDLQGDRRAVCALRVREVRVELSTRPDKYIGTDEQWDRAEGALREALERQGRDYEVSPGEGTFYGPKIDFHITDALGRSWQCGTCQLDFQFPERFDLTYQGADNAEHRPVMIHRALLGSMERFVGILIEHHAGRFPVWLAPTQAVVLPVADRHNPLRGRGRRAAGRGGRSLPGRRPVGVGRQEDPRRRGRQDARTCSWSATASRARRRRRFAPTTRATWGRCRSRSSPPSSRVREPRVRPVVLGARSRALYTARR